MKPASFICILMSLAFAFPAPAQSLGDRINHARNQQAKQSEARIDNASVRSMLGVLVYTDLTVNFEDAPARDVFKLLATELKINIIGRYSDDRRARDSGFRGGIDPEKLITLKVEDMPALTILELVLEQCADLEPATWQFRNGFVEVGTLDRLSVRSARVVRVYPIDDLLYDAPRFTDAPSLDLVDAYRNGRVPYGLGSGAGGSFAPGSGGPLSRSEKKERKAQQLIDFITSTVEPQAWTTTGGEYASIKHFDGALIIRAPDYIQRQIGGYPKPRKPQPASWQEKPEDETP